MLAAVNRARWVRLPPPELEMSGNERRRTPTKRLRNQIILRDLKTCRYCETFIPIERDITIDHVIPYANGGTTTTDNLVVACFPCNRKKACKTVEEAGMELLSIRFLKRKYQRNLYPASHWMQHEYDEVTQMLYIHVRYGPLYSISRTITFEDNLLKVDEHYDAPNRIVGIEVIAPDRRWGLEKILAVQDYGFTPKEKEYLRWLRDAKPWHAAP